MMTRAARQENMEMSKFMRRRLWEKSMMESIQSPKLRAHCSRWRTTPLQKISLFFSGFDLRNFKSLVQSEHWISAVTSWVTQLFFVLTLKRPTCMLIGGWRAQQKQIQGAAPGPLCRSLWNPVWSQPSFWSHPKYHWARHKTVGCLQHPPFLSGCQLAPGTEEEENGQPWIQLLCCQSIQCETAVLRFTLE